jgi:WD40 repeat protein
VSRPDSSDLILDPVTGRVRQTVHPLGADDTLSLAFAPGGTLASGTQGGIVQLWNPLTGAQIRSPLAVAAGPVTSIAFDPTGQRVATTGGQDGAVKLWSTTTLQQEGSALSTDQGSTTTAAFESGDAGLLAVNDHGNVFRWPMSIAAWEQHACAVAVRNLTRQEWKRYLTARSYTRVCP